MKKILSIIIVCLLVIIGAGCEKKSNEFQKPENYSSVLIVTINPQFKLYLDENGTVLAVEPVNDDAKTMQEDIEFENKNFEVVVEQIVTTANEKGFVKKDANINLEIVESKTEEKVAKEILTKATNIVNSTAAEINVEVTVTQEESPNVENNNNNNNNVTNDNENKQEETHTHEFSEATCTKAATCECGETEGSALGHNYKNGKCTRCGAKDPNFSYTAVSKKKGVWTFKFAAGDNYHSATLKLYNNENALSYRMGMSYDVAFADDPEIKEKLINECSQTDECVKYNNKYYWVAAGGGDDITNVDDKNTTVTLTDSEGNKLVLTRTAEKKLKVKTSPSSFGGLGKIPVGTVLTFS